MDCRSKSVLQHRKEEIISSVSALEACVGKTPGPRDLKVIDFLDEHAVRWISASPCHFISLASQHNDLVHATIAGGEPGFVKANARFLTIQRESIDQPDSIGKGDGWGSLFVIPSLKESLRVNGTVTELSNTEVTVEVFECYHSLCQSLYAFKTVAGI